MCGSATVQLTSLIVFGIILKVFTLSDMASSDESGVVPDTVRVLRELR